MLMLLSKTRAKQWNNFFSRSVPWYLLLVAWCGALFGYLLCQVPLPERISPEDFLNIAENQLEKLTAQKNSNQKPVSSVLGFLKPSKPAQILKLTGNHTENEAKLKSSSQEIKGQVQQAIVDVSCLVYGTSDTEFLKMSKQTWAAECKKVESIDDGPKETSDDTNSTGKSAASKSQAATMTTLLDQAVKQTSDANWLLLVPKGTYVHIPKLSLLAASHEKLQKTVFLSKQNPPIVFLHSKLLSKVIAGSKCGENLQECLKLKSISTATFESLPITHPSNPKEKDNWIASPLAAGVGTEATDRLAQSLVAVTGLEKLDLRTVHWYWRHAHPFNR